MGIFDYLINFLRRPKRFESSNQAIEQSINQSSEGIGIPAENSQLNELQNESAPAPIELQKESIQLGLAAGYTGRALKEIESSLVRIESQSITKDWFIAQSEIQVQKVTRLLDSILNILKIHDDLTLKHFEMIERSILSLQGIAQKAPEPLRTELLNQINVIETQLPPTPKMEQLINIVKQVNEISYTDLSARLGISESALRGLLTLTIRRTGAVQRFEKLGRGWVKALSTIESITQASNQSQK